jgi:hypothetical protein
MGKSHMTGLSVPYMELITSAVSSIQVGELELLDDGFVTSPENKPIKIQLDDLTVEFQFNHEGDQDPDFEVELHEKYLTITLQNFRSGIVMGGTTPRIGISEPLEIGEFQGQRLYLSFQVSSTVTDEEVVNSTLFYNFYLGESLEEESDDG